MATAYMYSVIDTCRVNLLIPSVCYIQHTLPNHQLYKLYKKCKLLLKPLPPPLQAVTHPTQSQNDPSFSAHYDPQYHPGPNGRLSLIRKSASTISNPPHTLHGSQQASSQCTAQSASRRISTNRCSWARRGHGWSSCGLWRGWRWDWGFQRVSYLMVACAHFDIMKWFSMPRTRRIWRARMP